MTSTPELTYEESPLPASPTSGIAPRQGALVSIEGLGQLQESTKSQRAHIDTHAHPRVYSHARVEDSTRARRGAA
jgi:hypothetical protein